ncbi:tetratricopeptide repeat-containing sensor histidine kinase [Flagellimonas myxillae]|uniref:tetratricopeptide repeat-containing sensor histidine kinase n=1 Tax=Flagellimonas myxillae TaxID=2942214 RepID=UPI00201F1A88|nr:ATP-binding protein [Muricauda myxillae]MCL6266156.1 tetratricopeptide repeat-containing sensor histidine kinase [Muricauda myxillae]
MSRQKNLKKLHQLLGKFGVLSFALVITYTSPAQVSKRDSLSFRLKRLETTSRFNPKDTLHINLLISLADSYRFFNNDSLYSINNRALKYCKAVGFLHGEVRALENLGCYYSDQGNRKESMPIFKQALELSKKLGDKDCELSIINSLSNDYYYEGNVAEALNLYLKGIDVAKQVGSNKMLSILNENIASLYADQKDFINAEIYYDTVQSLNRKVGNEIFHAETQSNMASMYKDAKNFDHAMFNINKSIASFEKHKVYEWLAYAYQVKGSIYLEQQKYQWALYWYDQSNLLHLELDDDREKIQLLNGMAKVYLGLGQDSISMEYAKEGLSISKKIKSLQGQRDCSETLYKLHKKKDDTQTALVHLETFKKLSDSLFQDKTQQSLSMLKTKLQYEQEKEQLIKSNKMALARQRSYIYFAVMILIVLTVITFMVRRSAHIQKKLNVELQQKSEVVSQRESELHEINKTKTKLFSIIGHDLRGPIGAMQGMLKLFTDGEIGKNEFMSFIPKFKSDVENISFTLNNLLSWGQTQLNGVATKPKRISLEKLVNSNIQLLSEVASRKSIKIINQLPENPLGWADQNHIDIVVRNLLSNAIKFTPEDGLITIEAEEKRNVWQIMIRDTGIGMNKEIQKKIFTDTSNITTYGTNNERGTGLGLSLCKEMILKNKGEIWVESVLRKGTTFFFTVPKAEDKYQQAS